MENIHAQAIFQPASDNDYKEQGRGARQIVRPYERINVSPDGSFMGEVGHSLIITHPSMHIPSERAN